MGKYDFFSSDGEDTYRYARRRYSDTNFSMITRHSKIPDIYEDDYEDDDEEVKYCPHCLEFGMQNKLGHRIVKEGAPPFPENDMENFLQCYICFKVFATKEIEKQKNLQVGDLKEHVMENPFEAGQTLIESVPKRTSPAGQKAAAKRKRERDRPHHKDKEIDEEMRRHGDRVTVLEDTDP